MKICRFNDNRIGIVRDGQITDVTAVLDQLPAYRWPLPSGDMFIAQLEQLKPQMAALEATGAKLPVGSVKLLSPVANPGKIIGAPANYQLHVDEAAADPGIHFNTHVKTIVDCGLFLKASSSLVGPDEGIVSNRTDRRTDHEVELGVVIGRTARNVSEEDALSYVAGYAIALDMTIRGPEERSQRKSLDSFAVLGPWLVTPDDFGDPDNVDFSLKIGGEVRQSANTQELIFKNRKLIAYTSYHYTLEPGDIIMTGTPAGVGPVEPGDVLNCWIDGIGEMDVAVRAE